MTYNLNAPATITVTDREGNPSQVPHLTDSTMAVWLAEQLENRVSKQDPGLEFEIAQELRTTGKVELTQEERDYLFSIVTQLDVDNLYKGQLLLALSTAE